jgi:hypothetical protein
VLDTLTPVKEVEVDAGSTPVQEATLNTVDTLVAVGSKILWSISGNAPTGKEVDDAWLENLRITPVPKAGSIDWLMRCDEEDWFAGTYKFEYVVA